jgi:hypothetical protein
MRLAEANEWFMAAGQGRLTLPQHPERPTAGDGQPLKDPPRRAEPENAAAVTLRERLWSVRAILQASQPPRHPRTSVALRLPFLPHVHGVVFVKGLFGDRHEALWASVEDEPVASWLAENIFVDFRAHRNLVGSLLRVGYHPTVRFVESRLAEEDRRETELARLRTWPSANVGGMRAFAIERRALGISKPVEIELTKPMVEIDWNHRTDRTGIAR